MNSIKKKITDEYGTINKFADAVAGKMKMSRTHLYKLINKSDVNPTIETLKELSFLTGIPLEEILDEFSHDRHRDGGPSPQRSD